LCGSETIKYSSKPKNTKTFTKRTIEINGIPGDAEYFIDEEK
jgi:hypothetical protein